ncbi:MAG: ATP-binding protein [Thermoplasmata archaeon]|nr:ATP-binding protein [Thermoplasmata archaeon]
MTVRNTAMIEDGGMKGVRLGEQMHVLMIEDNPADARLIKEYLTDLREGRVVTTAFKLGHVDRLSSGLELLDHGGVDLVLLDLSLPDSQGIETLRKALTASPKVPIVVVSGINDDEIARLAVAEGAKDFLWKGRLDGPMLLQSMVRSLSLQRPEPDREMADRVGLLERHVADIESSNKELEAFARTVSHELRAPIRAIQGFSRALSEDFPNDIDPVAREYVDRIVEASRKMEETVVSILEYSKLEMERLANEVVDLGSIVDVALSSIDGEVRERDARVSVDPTMAEVYGNGAMLVIAVRNILRNAVKFVPQGTRPDVQVSIYRINDRVRLAVEDNGIGIKPEHLDRVFEPFERLNGGRAFPGTGLGLATVARIVSRMGGTYGVESTPGVGSRFWIELPMVTSEKARLKHLEELLD